MFKSCKKSKSIKASKLAVALAMMVVAPAWGGEISPLHGDNSSEEISFCQQLYDTIEQTPDFWGRFDQEGFHYILTASPFKHHRVEKIHPVVVLTAGLHNYLRKKQVFMAGELSAIEKGTGSLKALADGVKLSKQYFYHPLDRFDFDWGDRYKEYFIKNYINRNDKICKDDGCNPLGNDYFAYRIKSNFYNQWDIDEYTIGIIYGDRKEAEYHVVDKYMQPHHKIFSNQSSYNMPSGYPLSTAAGQWRYPYVPIYVNGRSYPASIKKVPVHLGYTWDVYVENAHRTKLLCYFEFAGDWL